MSATAEHLLTVQEDDLPSGWTMATIQDLVGKGGVFIDGDWVESKDQDPDGDVRLIQLADVGDGEYRNRSARFLTYERAIQLGCTFLQKGDVLIARMPDPLGRACIFPGDTKPAVTVVDVAVVRSAAGEFNHRWLMYFVNAPAFRAVVASMQSGSTRKRISRGNLAKIALPVPPLVQQKHIVAEIEKQFSRLDEAVANLKRVKANLKRYKAAVLKAAVEGRLVEIEAAIARREGRNYETGAQLLQRILETRRSQWKGKGKYKEPAAPDTTDLPELPEGWVWAAVDQLAAPEPNSITDGPFGSNLKTEHYQEAGPRVIRLQNIKDGEFANEYAHITTAHFERLRKHEIHAGDLVIASLGDNPPRACIIPSFVGPAIVKADCIRFKPHSALTTTYLNAALNCQPTRQRVKNVLHGIGRPRLSLGEIRSIALPIPPEAEQHRIVAEIEHHLSLVRVVEDQIDTNLKRADRLRSTILSKVFSGSLERVAKKEELLNA